MGHVRPSSRDRYEAIRELQKRDGVITVIIGREIQAFGSAGLGNFDGHKGGLVCDREEGTA